MKLMKVLGGWLGKKPWTHFVTMTFAKPVTWISAVRQIGRFLKAMVMVKAWVWFVEKGRGTGRVHCHALVRVDPKLSKKGFARAWNRGRAEVEDYDPDRGAAFYLAKSYGENADVEWDIHLPDE